MTGIACAALYYAGAMRRVNAPQGAVETATEDHFRLQLTEIANDLAAGRLSAEEGDAAKRELAREYLRPRPADGAAGGSGWNAQKLLVPGSLALVVAISFVTYVGLGRPDLPAQPLAARPEAALAGMTLEQAVDQIERQLTATPDDARGWTVIAPAYMQLQRYADAERAYRRVLELSPPTPDAETDLAEALLMQNQGIAEGEPLDLLRSAAARDPKHVRSRFYLAGESMRLEDFEAARTQWTEIVGLAAGTEDWLPVAQQGLAAAGAELAGDAPAAAAVVDAAAIRAMVDGLSTRLMAEGGSLEEWTNLVRSRLVLDERDAAQAAYDKAVAAYPDASTRADLDAVARTGNLKLAETAT